MRKLLEQCPACGGNLIITQQTCVDCETSVVGRFQPTIFSQLSPDNLKFLEIFVKNRGNVKEMERETGWSYWTIRNQLNDIIEELGFEADNAPEPDHSLQRQDVLAQLDAGEITVDQAADLLTQLRPTT